MIEVAADLWKHPCDIRCVTTNGTVTEKDMNPMGAGSAGEASRRYPWLPRAHGAMIRRTGVNVYHIADPDIIMFPTKWAVTQQASLELIVRSADQLVRMVSVAGWETIALPRPGSGHGGLDWPVVRELLEPVLDDRFHIIRYKDEPL